VAHVHKGRFERSKTVEEFPMYSKSSNELVVSEVSVSDSTVNSWYFKFERFVAILETCTLWLSRPFRFEDQ